MIKTNSNKEKTSTRKKRKIPTYLIIIWSTCNPVSLFLIFWLIVICAYLVVSPRHQKNTMLIKEQLLSLCNGDNYIYNNFDDNTIYFDYSVSVSQYKEQQKLDSCDYDYSRLQFLLFDNDYYYFLTEQKTPDKQIECRVCRTTHDLGNFEVIGFLGSNIEQMIFGYDTKIYYLSNDSYHVFDCLTFELDNASSDSESAKVIKETSKKNYKYQGFYENYSKTFFGDCKRKKGACSFVLCGSDYVFDENCIRDDIYNAMKRFFFKPFYHLSSLESGRTAIIYYANEGFAGESECLIVDYSRFDNAVYSYQLFSNVNRYSFMIFPKIA